MRSRGAVLHATGNVSRSSTARRARRPRTGARSSWTRSTCGIEPDLRGPGRRCTASVRTTPSAPAARRRGLPGGHPRGLPRPGRAARRPQGRGGLATAVVVDVERIYDAFSSGALEAQAVAAYLRQPAARALRGTCCWWATTRSTRATSWAWARRRSCPRWWPGTASSAASPPRTATPTRTATALPELAIGRLPVKTAAGRRQPGRQDRAPSRPSWPRRAARTCSRWTTGAIPATWTSLGRAAVAAARSRWERPRAGRRSRTASRQARAALLDSLARGRRGHALLRPRRPRRLGRRAPALQRGPAPALADIGRGDGGLHLDLPGAVVPVRPGRLDQRGPAAGAGRRRRWPPSAPRASATPACRASSPSACYSALPRRAERSARRCARAKAEALSSRARPPRR